MLAPIEPKTLLDHLLERLTHWKEMLENQGFPAIRTPPGFMRACAEGRSFGSPRRPRDRGQILRH